jgi:hypothetical protein
MMTSFFRVWSGTIVVTALETAHPTASRILDRNLMLDFSPRISVEENREVYNCCF